MKKTTYGKDLFFTFKNGYLFHIFCTSVGWNKPSFNFGMKWNVLNVAIFVYIIHGTWNPFNFKIHVRYSILYTVYAFVGCTLHIAYILFYGCIQCIFFPLKYWFLWKSDLEKSRSKQNKKLNHGVHTLYAISDDDTPKNNNNNNNRRCKESILSSVFTVHKSYDTFRIPNGKEIDETIDRMQFTLLLNTPVIDEPNICKQQYNVQSIEHNSSTWTVISMLNSKKYFL